MESDAEYFARRASQETAAADQAADAKVQTAHLQMAERYRDLARAIEKSDRRLGVVRAIRRLFER